jgi:hypothetical protein
MPHLYHFLLLSFCLLLGGCSDPKEVSKDNFAKIIKRSVEKNNFCIALAVKKWPYTLMVGPDTAKNQRKLDALVDGGLLKRSAATREYKTSDYYGKTVSTQNVPVFEYTLSELGEKLSIPAGGFWIGKGTAWCYAHEELVEISNFTEPADLLGRRVSRVKFDIKAGKIKAWAKVASIQEAFPEVKPNISGAAMQRHATLVLTNDGWVDGDREHIF